MNDENVMGFVNRVVTERIKPGPRYMIKDIKKTWERTNGVGMNGLGVSFDVWFDCKSFVMIFSYECESFNINGKAENIAFYLVDKKSFTKRSNDDWEIYFKE